MTTTANDRQVGGSHYQKGKVQHWDLVALTRTSYLEGNATKYLSRWREKNGLQDLQKALHYVDKILELAVNVGYHNRSAFRSVDLPARVAADDIYRAFITDHNFSYEERSALSAIFTWMNPKDLEVARAAILGLMNGTSTP